MAQQPYWPFQNHYQMPQGLAANRNDQFTNNINAQRMNITRLPNVVTPQYMYTLLSAPERGCGRMAERSKKNAMRDDFAFFHEAHRKPLIDKLSQNISSRTAQNTQKHAQQMNMNAMQTIDRRLWDNPGSRDVYYQMYFVPPRPVRKRLMTRIYGHARRSMLDDPGSNTALITRAPCNLPRMKHTKPTYPRTLSSVQASDPAMTTLPVNLHILLRHAFNLGRSKQAINQVFGPNAQLTEHAAVFMRNLAKELSVGRLPNSGGPLTNAEIANQTLDAIKAHMWSGHRCLLGDWRKQWGRGCTTCKSSRSRGRIARGGNNNNSNNSKNNNNNRGNGNTRRRGNNNNNNDNSNNNYVPQTPGSNSSLNRMSKNNNLNSNGSIGSASSNGKGRSHSDSRSASRSGSNNNVSPNNNNNNANSSNGPSANGNRRPAQRRRR